LLALGQVPVTNRLLLPLSYLGPLKRKDLRLYCVPIWLNLNQASIKLQSNCNQDCFQLCPPSSSLQFSDSTSPNSPTFMTPLPGRAARAKLSHESPRVTHQMRSDLILASSYSFRKFLASNIVTDKKVGPDKAQGKRSPGRLVTTSCAKCANGTGPAR
jgi:hypothetical protein